MGLSVIHLSDIHIKSERDAIFSKQDEMINACVNAVSNKDSVVIVISGDIAFSGQEVQYALATDLLNKLSSKLSEKGIRNIDKVYVPGNHDCDFGMKSSVRDILIESMNCDKVDNEIYGNLISAQENYFAFAKSERYSDEMIQLQEVFFDGHKYGFILINTAWMSQLHEEYGKIVIPKSFMKEVNLSEYEILFGVFHHPSNWLHEACRNDFLEYINSTCDIVFVGHEHRRTGYEMLSEESSVRFYKAKEFQNSENSEDSGFSIFTFDNDLTSIACTDFNWASNTYARITRIDDFYKNKAIEKQCFIPSKAAKEWLMDVGFVVNHFSKENVSLLDVFVWPDMMRRTHHSDKNQSSKIKNGILEELSANPISIVFGPSLAGKTSVAKMMYMAWVQEGKVCVYLNGNDFKTSERFGVIKAIERNFEEQYSSELLAKYRNLPKEQKVIIVDEFDAILMVGNRRSEIVDVLSDISANVFIIVSSEIEMTSFLMAESITKLDNILSYEVLPFGNSKRKELVSKWYYLAVREKTKEELELKIDTGIELINKFLGNGAGFVPAYPIYIINALQNMDATITNNASRYAFLYETMIQKSFAKVSEEYRDTGTYNIDIELISSVAFCMLEKRQSSVSVEEIENITDMFNRKKKLKISTVSLLDRMRIADVLVEDSSSGTEMYRFRYPYIFYFFAGHYIAYNIQDSNVKGMIDLMSGKLYIEAYGNIMIFVCHFANNTEIIETILLNAYDTLGKYPKFDYYDKKPDDTGIEETLSLLSQGTVGTNDDVKENKNRRLERLDDMGINDGSVSQTGYEISEVDEEASEIEKDMASISAALKTMDVLGQIIQNYPGGIDGELKTDIIKEIYSLGMRSVEAISENMNGLRDELARFVFERAQHEKKTITMAGCVELAKKFSNVLTLGMVRGMVNKIAISINSKHLGVATKEALEAEKSVFAKLVLVDLYLNCFKQVSFDFVEDKKKSIEAEKTTSALIASGVLQQIVINYLDYNKCDFRLRQKLCDLFKLSEKHKKPLIEKK